MTSRPDPPDPSSEPDSNLGGRGSHGRAHGRGVDPESPDLLDRLGVVLPNDASALDPDLGYLIEERLALHPSGLPPAPEPPQDDDEPDGPVLTGLMMALLLFGVGMLGLAVTLFAPTVPETSPSALPLATGLSAAAADGSGFLPSGDSSAPQLLPEGTVRRGGESLDTRDLRPAVLVVSDDAECAGCGEALAQVAERSREYAIPVAYVVPGDQESAGSAVVRASAGNDADVVADVSGVLSRSFGQHKAAATVESGTGPGSAATSGKSEGAKADTGKADGPKADGPKADTGKADGPKADGPKAESGKAEGPKADGAKSDGDKAESGKGPQVVLVHADGVVSYVGPAEDVGELEERLSPLSEAGAGPAPESVVGSPPEVQEPSVP